MEIQTNRSRQTRNPGIVPPPDKSRSRRKAVQKLGNGHLGGRRFVSALRIFTRLGIALLILVFMFSVYMHALSSEKFNLRTVKFYGCKEIDPNQLEEIVRRDFPSNILRINLQKLRSRLEKETWVEGVEIRRVLPSDLIIYVHERIPSVILEMSNELMISDENGVLLGRYLPGSGKLDVPVFRGVLGKNAEDYGFYQEENQARIRQAMYMLAEIRSGSEQYTKIISEVDLSDPKNLKIILVDDTAEVHLGNKDYLKRFMKLINNLDEYQKLKEQYGEFEKIDLRFDNEIVYLPRRAKDEEASGRSARLEISETGR
jgi:cell division protein FtsQ